MKSISGLFSINYQFGSFLVSGRSPILYQRQTYQIMRRRYLTKFDRTDVKGGMYASNGYSLNLSQNSILNCVDISCKHPGRKGTITIADYGTADGRTSLQLLNTIIDKIQSTSGKDQQIMIYYEDQPSNDFNLLSEVIQGTAFDGLEGLNLSSNVFCATIGRSMYEQCIPDNSVDVTFSAITTHFLSRRPCRITGGILSIDGTEEEKALVKEQSRKDWNTFLYQRGRELKPGGHLVVLNVGVEKEGRELAPLEGGMPQLGKLLTTMLKDGLITKEEYLDTNLDADIYRTEADHMEPFTKGNFELKQLGLELVSVRSFLNILDHHTFDKVEKAHHVMERQVFTYPKAFPRSSCNLYSTLETDAATRKEYSERVVAGIKPVFYNVIYNGLSTERSPEERQLLTDIYFDRMRESAYNNHNHRTQIPLVETIVRKRL